MRPVSTFGNIAASLICSEREIALQRSRIVCPVAGQTPPAIDAVDTPARHSTARLTFLPHLLPTHQCQRRLSRHHMQGVVALGRR